MLKQFQLLICFLSCTFCLKGQNLVPNGSFENYTQCPTSTGQLSYTTDWFWAGASTDYYNSCSPQGNMSVPLNIYGYQYASEGNAYVGLNVYALHEGSLNPFYVREPVSVQLTTPLQIGFKYFVSFKVALTLNNFESCCATNKLGARFTTFPYTDANGNNPAPVNNFAHVYSDTIITDTTNWTIISGFFVSDSSYNYITLGNFFDSTQTQVIDYFNNYPQTSAAYYFLDEVKVSTDSLFVNQVKENNYDLSFIYFPNPTSSEVIICVDPFSNSLLKIYNSIGEKVRSYIIRGQETVYLEGLPNGMYYLKLENRNKIISKPLMINAHD
jgi:hypothetical protein